MVISIARCGLVAAAHLGAKVRVSRWMVKRSVVPSTAAMKQILNDIDITLVVAKVTTA